MIHTSSPLHRIEDRLLEAHQVNLYIKRDDLIHPLVSGNKFRKLKYNLLEMERLGKKGLLTFGGAFSNHIYAVAAAGQILGIPATGIIRGDAPPGWQEGDQAGLNPTLEFAVRCGMSLHFVSRGAYREKSTLIREFERIYPDYYLLPEGGTNTFAMRGAAEVVPEIINGLGTVPDYICVAGGTGGTVAGLITAATALPEPVQIIGFSALKGDFLDKEVSKLLQSAQTTWEKEAGFHRLHTDNEFGSNPYWHIRQDDHFGGYAKWTPALIDFINGFKASHGIALDPVYTGKMMYGIFDLVGKGFFDHRTVVAVHTGGLQGIDGFNARFGHLIDV